MKPIHPRTFFYKDLFLLTILIGIFYALFLGHYSLLTPDEARYAEIAKEMLLSNDYITPHLNGLVYLEKPILFYWLQSFAFKLFGFSEWAARLTNVVMAIAGCLLTYWAGVKCYSRRVGWYSALVLATSLFYFVMSHAVTLDMMVTTCLSLALFSLLVQIQKRRVTALSLLAALGCALAVLAKGLIGIVFPGLILLAWLLMTQEWRFLKSWYWVLAAALFLAVALPWHILVQWKNPDFFNFYFIQQHFLRYATLIAERQEPVYFYVLVLMVGLFPWTLFLLGAFQDACPRWHHRKNFGVEVFLLLWISIIFVFFSLSHSKLMPYILPIFPPMALLLGRYFGREENLQTKLFRLSFKGLVFIGAFIAIFLPFVLYYYTMANHLWVTLFSCGMGMVCLLSILLAFLLFEKIEFHYVFVILVVGSALTFISVLWLLPAAEYHSIKPLALVIQKNRAVSDKIVAYNSYYQDLPYYVGAPVMVVNDIGELLFGVQHHPSQNWMIDKEAFWKLFRGKERIWAISAKNVYVKEIAQHSNVPIYVVDQTSTNVLWTNRKT